MLSEFDCIARTIRHCSIIHVYSESIAPAYSTDIAENTLSTLEFIVTGATHLYRGLNNFVTFRLGSR
jgi:hypothetical protein